MVQLKPTRTVYTVGEFIDWQKSGVLQLKPTFQRREVWSPKAKSLLIDTVARGLPVPIIFLRRAQDVASLTSRLEVVDGQQRLRTLFSYIESSLLSDYDQRKDAFVVLPVHNSALGDKTFSQLSKTEKETILSYEISTHVFPPDTADEVVLGIFARINSTGARLNPQELRNALYFGAFKTLAFEAAFSNLSLWRKWKIFDDDDFARMNEVESTSDYMGAIIQGLQGKSKSTIDALYKKYDDRFLHGRTVITRLQRVLDEIDNRVGDLIGDTPLRRQALFYSLFTACYDAIFGLGSPLKKTKAKALPSSFKADFERCAAKISQGKLPEKVADAMDKATADKGRRKTRHDFLMKELGLVSA